MMNPDQISAAQAVLKTFTVRYGATASDTMLANCVYSILAAAGVKGQPAEEYAEAVKQATGGEITVTSPITWHEDGTFSVTAGNILDLPEGTYSLVEDEIEDFDEGLPDEAALKKMKKDEIVAQAKAEGILEIDKDDPDKKTLIARLIEGRKQE